MTARKTLIFSFGWAKTWQQKLFRKLKLISWKMREKRISQKKFFRCNVDFPTESSTIRPPPFKVVFTLLVITSKSPLFALFERPSKRMASVILQSHSEKLFKLTLSMNRFRHCISFDGCVMKTHEKQQ